MNLIITATTKPLYDEWFARAVQDDAVWPFLSFDRRTAPLIANGDDWDDMLVMDPSHNAVLRWSNDRSTGLWDARVSLWSLSGPKKRQAAGRLAAHLPNLARRFGVKFVSAACHVSNVDSARILTKRFGEPWGRQQCVAWNGKLGAFEDSLHFRASVEGWTK